MLLTEIATLDDVLCAYANELGGDFGPYRNHTYRVANLCIALSPPHPDLLEKVAIAAAFHDLGIWTDRTFDYLQPSIRLAQAYLSHTDRTAWSAEISSMILEHHTILWHARNSTSLAEPFRQADWIDVSMGLRRFGLSRTWVRSLYLVWPSAGFHARLVQLALQRWRSHPLSPLPMMRL